MNSPTAPEYFASSQSFAARMDGPLPRALREEADMLPFDQFVDQYAPTTGPLRLGQWSCTDAERPSGRLGPQARNYQATLALGDRIGTSRAAASGPVAALTEMLHERWQEWGSVDDHGTTGCAAFGTNSPSRQSSPWNEALHRERQPAYANREAQDTGSSHHVEYFDRLYVPNRESACAVVTPLERLDVHQSLKLAKSGDILRPGDEPRL